MFSSLLGWLFPSINSSLSTERDDSLTDRIRSIHHHLETICTLMPQDDTSNNWRNTFRTMQTLLVQHPNQDGIDQAHKIWTGIHGGMGSWNDYYIPHDQIETMRELNSQLEDVCARLSELLQERT